MGRTALMNELLPATRGLVRAPVFSAAAILCIGLGIGSTTAVWSAVERALLHPLPFRDPDRLVTIYRTTPRTSTSPLSAPNYVDLSRSTRQVEAFAATANGGGLLTLPEGAVQVTARRVTGDLFRMFGVNALRGRLLTADDDVPKAPLAAVMSEELWRERFGSDPSIIGQTIRLNGQVHTVVGIVSREFRIPNGTRVLRSDLWVPMRFTAAEIGQRRRSFLSVFGRLAPGVTPQAAEAELVQVFDGMARTNPELKDERIRALTMYSDVTDSIRTQLLLLLGAVGAVFLIAAINVTSLLLARSIGRQREAAVRSALGASRVQMLWPITIESVMLTSVGLVLGLALAWTGVRAIDSFALQRLPQIAGLTVDARVIGFAAVLAILVVVLCAGLPTWRSAAIHPQDVLHSGRGWGTSRASHRSLETVVVIELALSLVLLLSAGLAFKGFAQLTSKDPGFDPERILTLTAVVSLQWYPTGDTVPRVLEPVLEQIGQRPGIEAAGMVSSIPYDDWGSNIYIRYEGQPANEPSRLPIVETRVVTPQFFNVTRQRLIAGRLLQPSDGELADAPAVVVVNEALAKRDFPSTDPVGQRLYTTDGNPATIVGVVSNIRNFGPQEEPRPEVYWTARERARGTSSFPIMVRVKGPDPRDAMADVRAAIRSVDPRAAVTRVRTMREVIDGSVDRPRFYLSLLSVFAGIAMVLVACGIYGVLSYAAAQRTHELGIRTALGSTPQRTLALMARDGGRLIALGVGLGLGGAVAMTRLMRAMLYGVDPFDAATWAVATIAVVAVALTAMIFPAVRATRTDPLLVIRAE